MWTVEQAKKKGGLSHNLDIGMNLQFLVWYKHVR